MMKKPAVVLVEVLGVASVVHAVQDWRRQHVLERAERRDEARVNQELIDLVDAVHDHEQLDGHAEERERQVEERSSPRSRSRPGASDTAKV